VKDNTIDSTNAVYNYPCGSLDKDFFIYEAT